MGGAGRTGNADGGADADREHTREHARADTVGGASSRSASSGRRANTDAEPACRPKRQRAHRPRRRDAAPKSARWWATRPAMAGPSRSRSSDSINGSTYLARIIWSLGVAQMEKLGPLRPADIARMVMSRSPVSLEPPNVARYIRRSKPTCIVVDHTEGSSNFYKLNAEGKKLFQDTFGSQPN